MNHDWSSSKKGMTGEYISDSLASTGRNEATIIFFPDGWSSQFLALCSDIIWLLELAACVAQARKWVPNFKNQVWDSEELVFPSKPRYKVWESEEVHPENDLFLVAPMDKGHFRGHRVGHWLHFFGGLLSLLQVSNHWWEKYRSLSCNGYVWLMMVN